MNRARIIIYYLLELILSVVIFGLVGLLIAKVTIYSPSYIKNQFQKNNYYSELSNSIKDEMSNYIIQSGFEEEILENLFNERMIKKAVNNIVDKTYKGKDSKVDTTILEKNLRKNMDEYLLKYNIEVTDKESLDKFVEQMKDVYKDEITLSNSINTVKIVITKTKNIIKYGIIICIIIIVLLSLIIKIISRETLYDIPLFTGAILCFFIVSYINNNIIISNIFIWNNNVSNVLQSIINHILYLINTSGIILILLSLLDIVIYKRPRKKKRKLIK